MASQRQFNLGQIEKKVICPYNSSHLLLPERMQIHLIKCKAKSIRKAVVNPYNYTHEETWKDNPYKRFSEGPTEFPHASRGTGIVDSLRSNEFSDEDWGEASENTISYNPEISVLYKMVSRIPPAGLGKATRKLWREVETERLRRLKEGVPIEDLEFPTASGEFISIQDIVNRPTALYNVRERNAPTVTTEPQKSGSEMALEDGGDGTGFSSFDNREDFPKLLKNVETQMANTTIDKMYSAEKVKTPVKEQKANEHKRYQKKTNEEKRSQKKTDEEKRSKKKTDEEKLSEKKTDEEKRSQKKTDEEKRPQNKAGEEKRSQKRTDEKERSHEKTDEKEHSQKETNEQKRSQKDLSVRRKTKLTSRSKAV